MVPHMHRILFLGQHPLQQTHWVSPLVVARDSNVQMAQRTASVTQNSGRQVVNIRRLCERLVRISKHQKSQAAWIWSVRVPGVKGPGIGVAANFSTACWLVFLDNDTDISQVFNGPSCQQKLLPGSLQIYDVAATALPFVDVLFHCQVWVSATSVGSHCKEFEGTPCSSAGDQGLQLLWRFPFKLHGNQEQRRMGPSLSSTEKTKYIFLNNYKNKWTKGLLDLENWW